MIHTIPEIFPLFIALLSRSCHASNPKTHPPLMHLRDSGEKKVGAWAETGAPPSGGRVCAIISCTKRTTSGSCLTIIRAKGRRAHMSSFSTMETQT